jgi:hypothetical protein
MTKKLIIIIEAKFEIPDDIDGLSCLSEAIETIQQYGEASIIDANVEIVKE